jgi:outer membrane protein insertion porin family
MIGIILLLLSISDFRVRAIEITGNTHFTDGAIKKVMLTKTRNILRKGLYHESVFQGDLETIRNLYVYDGFMDVKVEHDLQYDSTDMQLGIVLKITEGEQYFVGSIQFEGNTVFADESLRQVLTMEPGQAFDPREVTADNYILRYKYDDLGYADIEVESQYRTEKRDVHVLHAIKEGQKQFVGDIRITGLRHTDTSVVSRRITFKHGDVFRYARVLDSGRALYRLGVFAAIRTEVEDSEIPNHKNVHFVLTEKELMAVNLRLGYGTRDLLRVGTGVTHNNLLGRAWQGNAEGKLSFIEQRVSTQITIPTTLFLPGNSGFGFFFRRLEEIGYETRSLGGNVMSRLEFDASELSAKYEIERIKTIYGADDSMNTDLLHGFIIGWSRDKRDDPFYTTRGSYLSTNVELKGVILPSDVDYVRPTAQIRFFRPVLGVVVAFAFKTGMVRPFAPTVDIPVYKRFYCGGSSSVRGYSERGIGPVDENGNPVGGRYLGELSAELRFPLYRILGGVVFVDGGNIWQSYDEIPQGLRWGAGAGLRLKSFLGSIRLDYGFKLGRREGESVGSLHFAIGEAF